MKNLTLLLTALLMASGMLVSPALAQDAGSLELRIDEFHAADHPNVTMVVGVPREMVGLNLGSDAFTVTENGENRSVSAEPVPTDGLQVVLLLDASGSMGGRPISSAKIAAQDFLDTMPDGVEIAVVSFADEPNVLSPFTTDTQQTSAAIADLQLGKNTSLYDGLISGAGLFDADGDTRRTLVLLSDGGDTASESTLEESIVALLDADVGFYAIELQSPEYDAEALGRLGAATGGIVVPAEDPDGLAVVFVDVASQIVNRYELLYESESSGPTTVVVTAQAGAVSATASESVEYPVAPPPVVTTTVAVAETDVVEGVALPSLRSGSIVVVSWLQTPSALWLGALAVFLGLLALLALTGVGQTKDRIDKPAESMSRFGQSKGKALASLTESATLLAERTVNRDAGSAGPVAGLLEKAGIQLRPGEFVVLAVSGALVVTAVVFILSNAIIALLAGASTLLMTRWWLGRRVRRRQAAFADQLVDVLQLMSGSIRTGFGLMQAMDTVAQEIPAPAGVEFQRVKIETQLGKDSSEALMAMADRVDSEDFVWVVEAIDIHRDVGGDLADILDSVMETIRDRIRIRRRIQTLSAEGRVSAIVLAALPVMLMVAMVLLTPDYIATLFTTGIGRLLLAFGLVLMVIGAFWMRRITALKF
jgi:tight adherence protein B